MSMPKKSPSSPREKVLSNAQRSALYETLQVRFHAFMSRHPKMVWAEVQARLEANPSKLWSVNEMESTGGEPDVVKYNHDTGEYTFFDCAAESPVGRRSLCYDREALESRKEHKPRNSVLDMAEAMGIELLDETAYRELQRLGRFDARTSSWIRTPDSIRRLGGALFADFRYGMVFVYHNGAQSYYASRGFRGSLNV